MMFVLTVGNAQTVGYMPVVVQKYGGTSVADPSRISAVADRVVTSKQEGNDLVVVVSAMGQTTNTLLELASQVSPQPHPREMDMLLTAGERISMALLAMALHDRGIPAVSFTGSQAGILTDSAHGGARITKITGERVRDALLDHKVVIVAGFQGVDPQTREVTTLGRGGSDTTAVALAATLDAEVCEILTDVDGVYTADPRLVPGATKHATIGHRQMLALATAGAGVLMPPSIEFAMEHDVTVHVRSSFSDEPGTIVSSDIEDLTFAGVAGQIVDGSGRVTVVGLSRLSNPAEHSLASLSVDEVAEEFEVEPGRMEEVVRLLHEEMVSIGAVS